MNITNDILADFLYWFVVVLLDDLLIYSKTPEDHVWPSPLCKGFQMRDWLSDHWVRRIASDTKRTMHHWTKAGSCLQLEGTPGREGYPIHFSVCQLLSTVCALVCWSNSPLDKVDKKGCGMVMGTLQHQGFQELKDKLCIVPILQFPNLEMPYTMVTNASGTVIGGVVM